ncbi:MAG: GTPase Era [Gammaproteobacteria bacterium]
MTEQERTQEPASRCGYVAILGRPNVGKSTLLNRILGQKISITSRRPQTTRHRILGIKTVGDAQAIYVDTPGLHQGGKRAMNRYMNRAASGTIGEVDVVLFVIEGLRWSEQDQYVLEKLTSRKAPVILVINKVDKIADKSALLPQLSLLAAKMEFTHIIPVSATGGDNLASLEEKVRALLPMAEHFYPEDQVTDRSERFLAAELIREKLMSTLGEELPYALTVEIEQFSVQDELLTIGAIIWVERAGQKAIVIGKQGARLKDIGQQARLDMQNIFEHKVFLRLWVRVKEGWSDDARALISLGYE